MPSKKFKMDYSESSLKRYYEVDVSKYKKTNHELISTVKRNISKKESTESVINRLSRDYTAIKGFTESNSSNNLQDNRNKTELPVCVTSNIDKSFKNKEIQSTGYSKNKIGHNGASSNT